MNKKGVTLKRISFILVVMGIMVSLYPLYTSLNAFYQQKQLESKLPSTAEETPQLENLAPSEQIPQDKGGEVPIKVIRPGEAAMRLEIPKLGLSAIVLSGTTQAILAKGPGWYEQSVAPGKGNTAIAGHRTMYGSWFKNINQLQKGDLINITYEGKKYNYSVEKVFPIPSNDWSVIGQSEESVLTLTTCYSDGQRLVSRALLIDNE